MGSIICFVKDDEVDNFIVKMKKRYGEDQVIDLNIRNVGPTER